MKKLIVLSVLMGLMALPMFASDITLSGAVTYGFTYNFDDSFGDTTNTTFNVAATIDDFNSLAINTDGLETLDWTGISKSLVTSDIGAWLGLPVGVVLMWGYAAPDVNEFQNISGYGNEDPWSASANKYWGMDFVISVSMVEIEVAADVEKARLLAGLAVKEPIPGLNAEVYYFQNEKEDLGAGRIGVDAAYSGDFGGFGLKAGAWFGFDLDDAAADAYALGAALSGSFSMITATVGLDGDETDILAGLTATVWVDAIDMLSVYGGVQTDLREATVDNFQGADLGINIHAGALQVYAGYLVTTVGNGGWKAPSEPTDGGAYLKLDISY